MRQNSQKLSFVFTSIFLLSLSACQQTNYAVEEAKYEILDDRPLAAIQQANQAIKDDPENPDGHFYRAMGLSELARKEVVAKRYPLYERMVQSLDIAQEFYSQNNQKNEVANVDLERLNAYTREFNAATKLIDANKETSTQRLLDASLHLKNALLIAPDSASPYKLLARVHLQLNDSNRALEMVAKAQKVDSLRPAKYNLEKGIALQKLEKYSDALPLLEEASKNHPNNVDVMIALYNTYQKLGMLDSAERTLEKVAKLRPRDPVIKLHKGRKLAMEVQKKIIPYLSKDSLNKINPDQIYVKTVEDIIVSIQRTEYEFLEAYKDAPSEQAYALELGIFYFNLGAYYREFFNIMPLGKEKDNFENVAKENFGRSVEPLREALSGSEKDVMILNMLYQVFAYLGDETEKTTILKKLNSWNQQL